MEGREAKGEEEEEREDYDDEEGGRGGGQEEIGENMNSTLEISIQALKRKGGHWNSYTQHRQRLVFLFSLLL